MKNKLIIVLLLSMTIKLHGEQAPRVGLALGGGGALGYAHIGVLKVLEEYNIPVHVVSGTSAGAIVGALYALGYRPAEIESLIVDIDFLSIVDDKKSRRVADTRTKMHPWGAMLGSTFYQSEERGRKSDFSIFKGYLIDSFFDYLYWDAGAYRNFEQFPRPFAAITTDTVTNKKLVIKDGPLGKAVRASMAIPLVITPEYYDGHAIVDGGVVNNLPVEDAFNLGADIVIAVDVSNEKNTKNGAVNLLLQQQISNDRRAKEMATVLISPDLGNYTSASFNRAKELIELGEAAAIAALPELLKYARAENSVINKPLTPAPAIKRVEIVGTLRPALIEKLLDIEAPATINRDKALAQVELISRHIFVSQVHYFYYEDTFFIEIREYTGTKVGVNASYNTDFGAKLSGGIEIREMQFISLFFQSHLAFHQGLESTGLVYLFPEQYPWLNYLFSWDIADNFGQGVGYPDSSILPRKQQPNHYTIATGVAITVGNYFYFSTLYQYQYMNTNAIFDPSYYNNIEKEHSTSLKEKIVIDYLDSNRYPTTGLKAFLSMEQGLPPFNYFKYWRVHSGIRGAIPLPKGFSIGLATEGGFVMGRKAPQLAHFSVGGIYTEDDYIYMQGFKINTVKGRSLWLARSHLMYSIASRFHVIAEWNGAFINETQRLVFERNNFYQTTGLKLAADFTPFLVEGSFFWNITQSKFLFGLILGSSY